MLAMSGSQETVGGTPPAQRVQGQQIRDQLVGVSGSGIWSSPEKATAFLSRNGLNPQAGSFSCPTTPQTCKWQVVPNPCGISEGKAPTENVINPGSAMSQLSKSFTYCSSPQVGTCSGMVAAYPELYAAGQSQASMNFLSPDASRASGSSSGSPPPRSMPNDWESQPPVLSSSVKAPYSLSVALTDLIMRDKVEEVVAAIRGGLSPDTLVSWCPPEPLSGGLVERSLLSLASFYGARGVAIQLLAHGANPNLASTDDGATPLHAAAAGNSASAVELIRLLLLHGADRGAVDINGLQPVHILMQKQQPALPMQSLQTPMQLVDDFFSDPFCQVGPHVPDPLGTSELSDINRPEYCTDDFRINCFKVVRCTKTRAHDWTECPFVHPGEKARRRSPQKFKYSSTACPDFRKGVCRRGDLCGFSHGVFECWLHPARYRTQMCKDGPMCTRRVCFFAHSLSEMRYPPPEEAPARSSPPPSPMSSRGPQLPPGSSPCASRNQEPMDELTRALMSTLNWANMADAQPQCQSPGAEPGAPCLPSPDQMPKRRQSDSCGQVRYTPGWAGRRLSLPEQNYWSTPPSPAANSFTGPTQRGPASSPGGNAGRLQTSAALGNAYLQQQFQMMQQQQQKQQQVWSPATDRSLQQYMGSPSCKIGLAEVPPGVLSPQQATRLGHAVFGMAGSNDSDERRPDAGIAMGSCAAPSALARHALDIKPQDSTDMSRVGSLSALDVSWVDDLTGKPAVDEPGCA
uniref:Zinc finger ccch domain-containing protein 29 n=1 Tax=Tetraselmis sp. GSL018 TaxID=582737 RepID=A0A061RR60_9CHLO